MANSYERRHEQRLKTRREKNAEFDNFDTVFSYDHLLESAKICKRGVNWKASVQNFMREMHYNTYKIYRELQEDRFKVKCTYEFDTYERGKHRHIRSVHIRERVVQRCLCDYCLLPILSRTFIYDNSASLKGKGLQFTVDRVVAHLQKYYRQHGSSGYVLLFDFSNFFGSISHQLIMEQLKEYVTDERILNLMSVFIDMYQGDEGLGLGSQISQTLALFAVSPLDHFIKDKCRVKHYVRYMDDGMIIHESKEYLEELLEQIIEQAALAGLTINKSKTRIVKLEGGFSFIKKRFVLTDTGAISIRIHRSSVTRMRRKLKKLRGLYDRGYIEYADIEIAYKSWRGFALKFDSYQTVMQMDTLYNSLFCEKERTHAKV